MSVLINGSYLKVVYKDRIGDVVGSEVLSHRAHTGAGHSDVDRELSGDRVEPEVQLRMMKKHRLDLVLTYKAIKAQCVNDLT